MTDIIKNKELQKDLGSQVRVMILDKMEDIEGIDNANWWPLAPGWWFIIIAMLLVIMKYIFSYLRRLAYRRTWQYKISEELMQMQRELNDEMAPDIIVRLSEILRRVAMHKYLRIECAGLVGDAWLKWLARKDKNKFDWVAHGQILTGAVYAPRAKEKISLPEVTKLIDATKKWVE